MFVPEYNGIPVPPPTKDPIKSCKYRLPCGWCERKEEVCIGGTHGVKEAVELLIKNIKNSFRYSAMNEYESENYILGYEDCLEELMKKLKTLKLD